MSAKGKGKRTEFGHRSEEIRYFNPRFDNTIEGKALTFYFKKILEDHNESELWEIFKNFGMVVNVFIARKRNKANKQSGFVRFI